MANLDFLNVLLDLVIDGDSYLLAKRYDGTDQRSLFSQCPLKSIAHQLDLKCLDIRLMQLNIWREEDQVVNELAEFTSR